MDVHVVGDSHVGLFDGEKGFYIHHIGPILAYSLCDKGTPARGREKLFETLEGINRQSEAVLLCFGEIDCRVMLRRKPLYKGKTVKQMVEVCAERYLRVVNEIVGFGFKTLVYNVEPVGPGPTNPRGKYPSVGSKAERTEVAKFFNAYLMRHCVNRAGVAFVHTWPRLYSKSKVVDGRLFVDAIHLGKRALPMVLAVINSALKKIGDAA